jgi:hypothetical protein
MTATVDLFEDVRLTDGIDVDEVNGILKNVKISGLVSANGYGYELAAYKPELYEGVKSYVDHAKKTGGRSTRDAFGWFENVKITPEGPRGDYHLINPKSELSVSLMRAAKVNPAFYGFSHHAQGNKVMRNGKPMVESISKVHSVDLVDDPATTHGLNESRHTMTLKEVLANGNLSVAFRGKLTEMADAGMMTPATPMDEPAAMKQGGTPEEALKAGFTAAIHAVVDDDSMDVPAKITKIKDLLKGMEKHLGTKDAPADAEDAAEPPEPTTESKRLRAELDIRDLAEDAGLKFRSPEARKSFLKSLIPLSEAERKTLIEERQTATPPAKKPAPVRSGGTGTGQKLQEAKVPDDPKQLKSFLNTGR